MRNLGLNFCACLVADRSGSDFDPENIFLWLKFLSLLDLNKTEHFAKVSGCLLLRYVATMKNSEFEDNNNPVDAVSARSHYVKGKNRVDIVRLVRSLQKLDHHSPCFRGPKSNECSETDCVWRVYCLKKNET